jgi:uncharacterized protein YqeY
MKECADAQQFHRGDESGDEGRRQAPAGAIRLIMAALKEKDIEARGAGRGEASAEEILGMLQKMIKQRQESAEVYDKGGRPELAAAERAEIAVISSFLPAQMGEDEVKAAIAAAIAATGAASMKDMGKVVAELRGKFAGRMDFGKASGLVKAALSGG